MSTEWTEDFPPLHRLTRDLQEAATVLTTREARYLVDYYYQLQRDRIRADNQVRSTFDTNEPNRVIAWLSDNTSLLEQQIKRALDAYSTTSVVGAWSRSIVGIGPVLAAGLLAHIDIEKAPTVGHIWRFAGLDPTLVWERSTKRPWNAALKTLCWKIGESFVKTSGHAKSFYGPLYVARKQREEERNAAGMYADQAAVSLGAKRWRDGTMTREAYEQGRLPQARIHLRAQRWTVKLFLAHWHAVAYQAHYGTPAPKPYILTQPEHVHEVLCPNWPF
jgi:transposase